eukprot:scaffold7052_cov254-Pinguiococcus_pyrenoidosus.AAC.81
MEKLSATRLVSVVCAGVQVGKRLKKSQNTTDTSFRSKRLKVQSQDTLLRAAYDDLGTAKRQHPGLSRRGVPLQVGFAESLEALFPRNP